MPKRGENIYKRKDGRWRGGISGDGRPLAGPSTAMFMPEAIGSAVRNGRNVWTPVEKRR